MIKLIHTYEASKPKQHPVGMTSYGLDVTMRCTLAADECRQRLRGGPLDVVADMAEGPGRALADRLGPNAAYQHLDVGDEASWTACVRRAVDLWGGLDVLVNTAGIAGYKLIRDTTVERYMNTIRINQIGTFMGIKSAIDPMIARGGGSIINISSHVGVRAAAGMSVYSSTKFAVRGLTQSAAIELAAYGIRVNALLPGVIDTPPIQGWPQERREKTAEGLLFKRLGSMRDTARMTVFLASDDSAYCTGADFAVDGGAAISAPRPAIEP